jgi:hypothetical protein
MRASRTLRTSIVAFAFASLPGGCLMTRGNGEPATEAREVAPFTGIHVGGAFQLQAEPGPETRVTLEGDANLLPMVEVESTGGTLRVALRGNVLPDLPLKVVVRAPELRAVDLSGAARGDVTGISGASFAAEVSGASTLHLAGRVDRLVADLSGASELAAEDLVADAVEVASSGASSASVTANTSLTADASGASSVTWGGNATKVQREATGASSIEQR